ncbi:MAG: M28 family metallopeptidase [Robiginitomaculum sp.]
MRIASLLSSIALIAALSACQGKSAQPQAELAKISGADIARHIEVLASDKFEGRAPSGTGADLTTHYIAGQMKASGLKPMGVDGTYFQPVTLTEMTAKPSSFARITMGKIVRELEQRENAVFWTKQYTDTAKVENSELVFVGYGTVAPEYDWNDYAGLDVKGKTVVMLVNDPGYATKDEALFKGDSMTYYGRWTYKYEEAARQGAAAAIVIHETKPASYPWSVVADSWTGGQFDLVRPDKGMSRPELEGWVTTEQAREMFARAGLQLEEMKAAASHKGFKPVPMGGLTLDAQIDNDIKTIQSRNVAGGVVGSKYPDEYVLYMGHWDHLGMKDGKPGEDLIYNGAVDNATGTAAVMEIGKAFASGPQPERSVIIVSVTAEESGLLGSAYYGEAPLVPLAKTVAGINIDAMFPLGETKDIMVIGYGASQLEDRLKAILDTQGKYIVPDQNPSAGYFYRSDHISLAKKGVPMLYADGGVDHIGKGKTFGEAFGKDYTANRYHQTSDDYSADWDMSGIEATTQLFYELGMNIANTQDWPTWYEGSEFRAIRDASLRAAASSENGH